MPAQSPPKPVEGNISKVYDEIAVGSPELSTQVVALRVIIWTFFTILTIVALAGFLGRGHFAKEKLITPDGGVEVSFDRIARFGTPAIMTVRFKSPAPQTNRFNSG